MNAAFFGLAFLAALNPKLLAIDLLLIDNQRSRLMFLCLLLGGLTVSMTIGLLDVFVLHADAVKSQRSVSAGVDLGLGAALLAVGALLAAGRLHGRQKAPASAGAGRPSKTDGWAQRVLREPRFALAVLIGAVAGLPGASYITALHQLTAGTSSGAAQTAAVVVFCIIGFSLVIVPFAFLEFRPEATKARLRHVQGWLTSHARQLVVAVVLLLGAYMAVSGLVRLL